MIQRRWNLCFLPVVMMLWLCAMAFGQNSAGAAATTAEPAAPHLEFVFEEFVTLAPNIHPGPTPYGERNFVPITGGTFSGPKIRGKVLNGGWDWQLATKAGGCHQIKADYMIQTDDGAIINILNKGTMCESAGRGAKTYTSPTFEAPLGPYEWLNSGAYVGTLDGTTIDGKPAVHIRFYVAK